MSDMNEQQILEYNKRCAKFMGYQVMTEKSFLMYEYPKGTDLSKVYIDTTLVFHSDWNWIMEVVEAIEKLEFRVEIAYNQVDLECMRPDLDRFSTHINLHDCDGYGQDLDLTKKGAVVKAITQFLIWYNENTTN